MAEELNQTASGAPGEGQLSTGVDFLSRALKMFFGILAAFIIVSLGWFLIFGGSFIVDTTTESVIVLQFGKFKQECKEGWHWFMPYPVNKIALASSPYRHRSLRRVGRDQGEDRLPGSPPYKGLAACSFSPSPSIYFWDRSHLVTHSTD